MFKYLLPLLTYLWASPYTLLGLFIGLLGLGTGGNGRIRDGVGEFSGGAVTWCLRHLLPNGEHVLAFTLGHTVLGKTVAALDLAHEHEMVHVRQYERWGPLMAPMYLGWSAVRWYQGKCPYRDNPFEVEAFGDAGGK